MADYNSVRQSAARRAYGDPKKSVEAHGKRVESFNVDIRKNGAMKNRALVLSAMTGLCASSGVIGVVYGAPQLLAPLWRGSLSLKTLLWALTGGFCLAMTTTVSFSSERAIYDLELRRELWEIENHLVGELQEMIVIYQSQGLSEEEAFIVTRIFAKQKPLFAQLMMVEELGYSRLEPPTTREAVANAAVPTALGFVLGLTMPLLPAIYAASQSRGSSAVVAPRARAMCVGALVLSSSVVSYMHTEVFFGAYAQTPMVLKSMLTSMLGVGTTFAMSFLTSRWA